MLTDFNVRPKDMSELLRHSMSRVHVWWCPRKHGPERVLNGVWCDVAPLLTCLLHVADRSTGVLGRVCPIKRPAGSSWEGVCLNVTLAWPCKVMKLSLLILLSTQSQ